MTDDLIRRERLGGTGIQGKRPCDGRGRGRSDAAIN